MRKIKISEQDIERLRIKHDLVDIVNLKTSVVCSGTGNGDIYKGLCPNESCARGNSNFNFIVNARTQSYFCFACKRGGNIFTFLEDFTGLSFHEAYDFLDKLLWPVGEGEGDHEQET